MISSDRFPGSLLMQNKHLKMNVLSIDYLISGELL
jgi:hypothetical protein